MRLMPPEPLVLPKKKRRTRKARVLPPPCRSARVYLYIDPSRVHLFRYLLEAEDNLGIMTVVDRWRAALMVRFSPHQEEALLRFLEEARWTVPFEGPLPFDVGLRPTPGRGSAPVPARGRPAP